MSADNYWLIRPDGKRTFVATMEFASCDIQPVLPIDRRFGSVGDAYRWCETQGYTEYGIEIDESCDWPVTSPMHDNDRRHLARLLLAIGALWVVVAAFIIWQVYS